MVVLKEFCETNLKIMFAAHHSHAAETVKELLRYMILSKTSNIFLMCEDLLFFHFQIKGHFLLGYFGVFILSRVRCIGVLDEC